MEVIEEDRVDVQSVYVVPDILYPNPPGPGARGEDQLQPQA